jgi:hypothetical protein
MVAASLITGTLALILSLGGTLVFPLCTPCIAFFLGPISGFLTSQFEKPDEKRLSITHGTFSGAIAGVGAFLGQSIGATINGLIVGPAGSAQLGRSFGFSEFAFNSNSWETGYWVSLIGSTVCISLFNILIMAGMGAVGGLLWWQFAGSKKDSNTQNSV